MKKNYFKLLALVCFCLLSSTIFAAGSVNVTTFADLQTQFGLATTTGSPSTIVVTAAITVNADFNMTSATYPVTITIGTTSAPITVTAGTLTIGNNVTISETKASGITVTGGNLVVNTGSIITSTTNPTILASGGNVTINGGTITCASTGVVTNIKVTNGSICRITGGTITCSSSTGVNLLVIDDSGGTGGGKLYITGGTIQSTNASGTGAAIYLNAATVGQLWISGSPTISYLNTGSSISTSQGASRINIATKTATFTGNIKTSGGAVINNYANSAAIAVVDNPSGTYTSAQTVTLSGGIDLVTQYTANFTNTYAYLIANGTGITGTPPTGGVGLKYTTDGTDPISTSSTYSTPLTISTSSKLKVAPYIFPTSSTVGVVSTFTYYIPPVWTTAYPAFALQTTSGFNAKVNINEPGNSYYVVLPSGAAQPSPAQVKAGQNAAGTTLASNLKGTISCSAANTEYTSSITGLTDNTTYDVYFVAEDMSFNALQASVTKVITSTVAASSVADPVSVSSSVISQSQINIVFAPNANTNNVLIAWNTTNSFGTPVDGTVYSAGNALSGGGTILYNGGTSPFSHSSLTPNTIYYYKMWSVDGSNLYSSGLFTNSTTYAAEPTTQASAITFSAVTVTGMTIGWTNGNGTNRLVLVKAGSAVDSNPVDGTGYTANSYFGTTGTQIGTGNYAVYNSTGNSIAITGLTGSTTYNVAIYEYNGTTGTYNYLTSSPATASQSSMMTVPAAPTALTFSSVNSNSFKASFTAPGIAPTGYLVLRRTGAAVAGTPVPGTTYTQGQTNIGSGTPSNEVVYVGTSAWTGYDQISLTDNKLYYYAVYSYNGNGLITNYSTALTGNQATGAFSPPTATDASNVLSDGFTANWNAVPGATSYSLDVNTTPFLPLTENFERCLLTDVNISSTISNYLQTSGWTSTSNAYQSGGSLRLGYTDANTIGDIITPQLNLSGNGGNANLSFDCVIYGNTAWGFRVYHAADGVNWVPISGIDTITPSVLTTKTYSITGGTSLSKIKIVNPYGGHRFLIDNFRISQINNVAGYDNLTVASTSTSQVVTGLTPGITYYYRVRANGVNSSSVYSLTVPTVKSDQAIIFAAPTKAYGDADFAPATSSSGLTPTYGSSNLSVATIVNGKIHIVGVGNSLVTASQVGNVAFNAATDVAQTLTVNTKTLTVTGLTGVAKLYDGLNTATLTGTPIYAGLVNAEVFAVTDIPVGTFADVNAGNAKTINVSGITAPSANYTVTQPSPTADITPAPLTITGLTGVSKEWDGTTAATLTGTPAYVGLVNGETFAVTGTPVANFADPNVATGISIIVTGFTAPTANYTVTQPTGLTADITSLGTAINNPNNIGLAFTVNRNGVISNVEGNVEVIAFNGVVMKYEKATIGRQINLSTGAYILRITTAKNTTVQKVVL
jgi:hypothetical protein